MKKIFILGSNLGLSIAEIISRLDLPESAVTEISADVMIADCPDFLDAAQLMSVLGGTIKIGQVIDGSPDPEFISSYLSEKAVDRPIFGISRHGLPANLSRRKGLDEIKKLIRLGMETKRLLKESGISSRFVRPQEGLTLSSVTVEKNGLLGNGAEFIIFGDNGIAVTEAIQPFEELSESDFGRPARDPKQGMLPPKLAIIMLNLAKAGSESHVWDPFCGSGTVLTESCRLGIAKAYGTDINPQAIRDTEKNVAWFTERLDDNHTETVTATGDARDPLSIIPKNGIDAVVSEVYLGPPRSGHERRGELTVRLDEITLLIEQSLKSWKPYLKSGARIVLALPAYVTENEVLVTEPRLPSGYECDEPLQRSMASKIGNQLTANGGILYGRKGQMVWREIVRLRRV